MRPGRELDCEIAQKVFGREVFVKKKILHEMTEQGDRPLRRYTKEISAAWEVVEKLNITVLPIEDGQWFALLGKSEPWKSPADFIQYLGEGKFVEAGAAISDNAATAICQAALRALTVRSAKIQ